MQAQTYRNVNNLMQVYSIAYACPIKVRKKSCPLFKIEHISFNEKLLLNKES